MISLCARIPMRRTLDTMRLSAAWCASNEPSNAPLLRALPDLKEDLEMNVELACPAHFIPELPGWQERNLFITQEGKLSFYHYDLYAQALAKIERGHALDVRGVEEMFRRALIEPIQ